LAQIAANQTLSDVFVPLIHAILNNPHNQIQAVRNLMNGVARDDNFWNTIVAAYQNAFQRRGITAASIGLTPNGYLEAGIQQR
jgi:hypothetical protein